MGKISQLPVLDRPREKAYKYGVSSLSDYELLAILLRTGTKNKSVIDLSIEILNNIVHINELQSTTIEELTNIKGIGKTKAIELLATIELGKRINSYNKIKYI